VRKIELQEHMLSLYEQAQKYEIASVEYANIAKEVKQDEVELAEINVKLKKQENEFSEWARDFAQDIKAAKENQILANKTIYKQQGEQIMQAQLDGFERKKIVDLYGEEFATSLDLLDNDQKRLAVAKKAVEVEKEKEETLRRQRTITIDQGNVAGMSEFQLVNSLKQLKSQLQGVTTAQGGPAKNQDLAWIALTNKIGTLEKALADIRTQRQMDEKARAWEEKKYGAKSDSQLMVEKLDSLLKVNTDLKTMFANEGLSVFRKT